MKVKSTLILLLIIALVGGAGYYLTYVQPIFKTLDLGLDLMGGIRVVYEPENPAEATDEAMDRAMEIIRWRVDRFGVAEPVIRRAEDPVTGTQRIIVELPGVKNAQEARRLIGKTAQLKFVDQEGKVILTGDNLERARAAYVETTQKPVVTLDLDEAGTEKFAEATRKNLGKIIFIVLDDEVIQAPVVQEVIPSGQAEITGYESLEEAQQYAALLNSGALPLELKRVENRTISATLGQDSIEKSQQAGLYGLAALVLFMVLFYRLPGVVADFALAIYIFLVLGILAAINATLTLPGIAGIILSIGMAVDANVIIFERIKEEIRNRKTIRTAIDTGFRRAFRTILDANVTTLIGAAVLIRYATGPVKGFGVTLAIGILASMFTAVVITRFLLRLVVDTGFGKKTALFFGMGGKA